MGNCLMMTFPKKPVLLPHFVHCSRPVTVTARYTKSRCGMKASRRSSHQNDELDMTCLTACSKTFAGSFVLIRMVPDTFAHQAIYPKF